MNILQKILTGFREKKGVNPFTTMGWVNNRTPIFSIQDNISYIDKAYKMNALVYSIVHKIALKAAGIYPKLCELKPDGTRVKILSHPILDLLYKPNPATCWSELEMQHVIYKLVTGDSYIWGLAPDTGSQTGMPKELWVLPSQYMQIIGEVFTQPPTAYRLTYSSNKATEFLPEEILHIKNFDPAFDTVYGNPYGMSPIKAASKSITANNSGYDALVKIFQNLGQTGIVTGKDGAFTPDQAKYVEDLIKGNRNDIIVTNAVVDFLKIGLTPDDMAIIEANKMTLTDMCNVYHVDPKVFGDSSASTYNNMEEAIVAFINDAVIPEKDLFYEKLNQWLVPKFKDSRKLLLYYDQFEYAELRKQLLKDITILERAYWITGNEKRKHMNYDKFESEYMDEILIPSSVKRLEDIEISDAQITRVLDGNTSGNRE